MRKTEALGLRDRLVNAAEQILGAMRRPHMVRLHAIIMSAADRFQDLARKNEDDAAFPVRGVLPDLLIAAAAAGLIKISDPRAATLMLQHMIMAHVFRTVQLGLDFAEAERRVWPRYAVGLFLTGSHRETPAEL